MSDADLAFRREQITVTERKTLAPRANWPARVCLVMIAKDEANVIGRCIESCLPWISCAYISVNGDDETPIAANAALGDKPSEIERHPWVSYGHNMTEAIQRARDKFAPEMILIMDADETIEGIPELGDDTSAGYMTTHIMGDCEWQRLRLMRADAPWEIVGVHHELPLCRAPHTVGKVIGAVVKNHNDGGNGAAPVEAVRARYAREAEQFEREFATDPTNARAAFYLGQSYRDAGEYDKAIEAYRRRIPMAGFIEETFYSQLQIARIQEWQGVENVALQYMLAYQLDPKRVEPMTALARMHREKADWVRAELYARQAVAIASARDPGATLFLERSSWEWRPWAELSVAARFCGRREEGLTHARRAMACAEMPDEWRQYLRTVFGARNVDVT